MKIFPRIHRAPGKLQLLWTTFMFYVCLHKIDGLWVLLFAAGDYVGAESPAQSLDSPPLST